MTTAAALTEECSPYHRNVIFATLGLILAQYLILPTVR